MENKAIKGFNEAINEVINLQDAKNYADAALILKKLVEIVEDANMFEATDSEAFFCFNNLLEQVLYDEVFKPGKKLSQVPNNYADMYHKFGALLFETKMYDEAELILKEAQRWNPVDVDIIFELSEVYKMRGDWETYLPMMKQCLFFAYSKRTIARCYRNLGFYYIEQNQFDVAIVLYYFSLFFDRENETALHELAYIEEKTGKIPPAPSSKEEVAEIVKVLEDNDIQAWGNPKVYNIAVSLAQEAMKAEMPNETRFFLGVAYDLSGDEEIGQILEKMDAAAAEQRDYDEDDFEPDEGRYDGEV